MSTLRQLRSRKDGKGRSAKPGKARRYFAALLASAGIAAACGGKVSVYYDYPGAPHGGEAGTGGQGGADTCSLRDGPELTCDSGAISNIVYAGGEPMAFDRFGLLLEDIEAHGAVSAAVVPFLDADCNIIEKDTIEKGQTKEVVLGGKVFDVKALDISPGYTFGDKWAHMEVRAGKCGCWFTPGELLTCDDSPLKGIVNVGEGLPFGLFGALLDDVEAVAGQPNAALLSFIGEGCIILRKEKVYEGETKTMDLGFLYEVTAKTVAAGSTSQWADLDIRSGICGDCLPHWSCEKSRIIQDVTLHEGESFQMAGFELTIDEITEHVGGYDGISCPLDNVIIHFTMNVDGVVSTHSMPSEPPPLCLRSPDGCYSIKFHGISIDLGPPQEGTCPVLDEETSLTIRRGN